MALTSDNNPLDHEKLFLAESANRILPFKIEMTIAEDKSSILPYYLYLVQPEMFRKDEIVLKEASILRHYLAHSMFEDISALEQICKYEWGAIRY